MESSQYISPNDTSGNEIKKELYDQNENEENEEEKETDGKNDDNHTYEDVHINTPASKSNNYILRPSI